MSKICSVSVLHMMIVTSSCMAGYTDDGLGESKVVQTKLFRSLSNLVGFNQELGTEFRWWTDLFFLTDAHHCSLKYKNVEFTETGNAKQYP